MPRILRTRGRKDKAKRTKLTRYGSDCPAVHGSVEYNSSCYYMSCHERVDRIPVERHRAAISPGVQRAYARQGDHGAAMAVDKLFEAPRSEEHTSELQSLMRISYAVFCLKKQKTL